MWNLHIIAFFAGSDMLIVDNLMDQFLSEVTIAEAKAHMKAAGIPVRMEPGPGEDRRT